jgi:hypothetical protein
MTKRDGAHDEDNDMLVIRAGLGGRVAALQLAKKNNHTLIRRIYWLPKVMVHAGVGVVGCSRVLQRMWKSRSTSCDCTASTDSESRPGALLSAGLGCLMRAMRWRTAASSTAADQERSPSHSLAGLPWHEFIRRVAAAEADAERAAIGRAYSSSLRLPFVIGIRSRTNSSGRAC